MAAARRRAPDRGSSLAVATRAPPMVLICEAVPLTGLDQAVEVGHHLLAASALAQAVKPTMSREQHGDPRTRH